MKRECCVLLVVGLAPMWSGYNSNKSPTTPTSLLTAATSVALSVTSLDLTGNVTLTTVGETSQLTATATLSDGTVKDVTRDANTQWTSSDPSIIRVSSSGLLTVVALGSSNVDVTYLPHSVVISTSLPTPPTLRRSTNKIVTATPPGTFVITGLVREPGHSGVPSVRVTDTASGRVVQTNQGGNYSVAQLPAAQAHLKFEKDGYEPVELDATPSNSEVAIQRIIRLVAGDTVTPLQLAPHDLSYTIGADHCYPCRLIRVTVPTAGKLHVDVTWTEAKATLNLWAGGQLFTGASRELVADVPVKAPGEVVMYLGMLLPAGAQGGGVTFTIATAPPS
jgi:Bacterial Ig-like domain (group 2)